MSDHLLDVLHQDKPFFLYLSYSAVHIPLQAPAKVWAHLSFRTCPLESLPALRDPVLLTVDADFVVPFANYRFLDEFSRALGHNMDKALDPVSGKIMLRRPSLWFFAFFGFWFPSAYEPAVVLRKTK